MKKILFGVILSVAILFIGCSNAKETKYDTDNNSNIEVADDNINTKINEGYKLEFGELLDSNISEFGDKKILTIKAKIKPSVNNRATINQNGYNIENLILEQLEDEFDEIQYWAVADMENGSEDKVISFTVDKEMIEKIKNKEIVGNKIVENAKDVWILPSLLE